MQFAVPQFTDVEDKLVGPLTLKQFLIALGFGGVLFFFWSIIGSNIIFVIFAVPIVGLGIYVTIKKINGRPFYYYLLPLMNFVISSRIRVFKREPNLVHFASKQVKKEEAKQPEPETLESADSRLRKLAYLLDKKLEEEKELITHVTHGQAYQAEVPSEQPLSPSKILQPHLERPVMPKIKTVNTVPDPMEPKRKKFNPSDILQRYGQN